MKLKSRVLDSMKKELVIRRDELQGEPVETIYFGGGTPSVLSKQELIELMKVISDNFNISSTPEVTFEANPEHISNRSIHDWLDSGINRLSIGLQSFSDSELKFMNRGHTANQGYEAVLMAKQEGLSNITLDLIYGLPNSSVESWMHSLDRVTKLEVPHVSAYHLTIENRTHLGYLAETNALKEVDEDFSETCFKLLHQTMNQAGTPWYEISNFAAPGMESKHNSAYWFGVPYLGIGPSAHSYKTHQRSWNVSSNLKYVQALEAEMLPSDYEVIDKDTAANEYVLTRLRTRKGISLAEVSRLYGDKKRRYIESAVGKLKSEDYFDISDDSVGLTEKGLLMADFISMKLFE